VCRPKCKTKGRFETQGGVRNVLEATQVLWKKMEENRYILRFQEEEEENRLSNRQV
jgi:hypothetical protein